MKNKDKKRKIVLLLCNLVLILTMVTATGIYSRYIYRSQEESNTIDFIRMIESMKQVSQNYLNNERGYVKDWASYISKHNMTLEEALDFLRGINANQERFIHIVDMDSYEAYSSYYPKGKEKIDTYLKYKGQDHPKPTGEADVPFGEIMENMFRGTDEEFAILGKYRLQETQAMAVGVGAKVSLHNGEGKKDYLLLRVVPVDVLKKSWVFPMEYASGEVGIITASGDYVIQSASMKSQNFLEYVRGYNFQDDYNKVNELQKQLENTENGLLRYKNFKGTECLWYYSSFGANSGLDILGMLDIEKVKAPMDSWYIVVIVCGTLILLVLIDGAYLLSINRRLKETVKISEHASQAKTQFLSAMSHDIRTPLNAVMGMMQIAWKKADDPDEVIQCMEKGIHSGKQLLTLINDVLDISKIESGKFTLNPESVSLIELMQDLTEMVAISIEKKNITLQCEFEPLPHKWVYVDKMRLNQIYLNLLTNAVKYTEKNGKITLRLHEKTIAGHLTDTRLIFSIEDNGIGMTKEFQKQMYSTFSREVKTQVNSTQGTGLGLSIVKQMVELMGGTITCESTPGVGTSFTVSIDLPVSEEGEKSSSVHEISPNMENIHLLIAEDNELNWEIINELLSEQGITCDHAENGSECVNMLTNAPKGTYTAILMDVHMPIMNGYEATKTIRGLSDPDLSRTAIIAMTADAFAEDVQACINCGMNGHVAKPVDMDKLLSYLARIRNGQL